MEKITAVVITQDEERNIGRCLASLQGVADEVVVVDSGSTDRTEAISTEAGARFLFHPWEGYAQQKNYANSLATNPWILSIDADEALSPELRESLLKLKTDGLDKRVVYFFNRLTNYCGRWIRHGDWYPDPCARLWPTGAAVWDGEVHEELRLSMPLSRQKLRGVLWHYSYYTREEHAERIRKYAKLAGDKAHRQGKRCSAAMLRIKACWAFVRGYILRLGFMDGKSGYIVARMSSYYTALKYRRLRELNER